MLQKIFTMKEIIIIVMTIIEELEVAETYGQELADEMYFPKPILDKLNSLSGNEYEYLLNKATTLAENVFIYKSGELNELNSMHNEITILANRVLEPYIVE